MKIHWVKQLSLILDKAMTSFFGTLLTFAEQKYHRGCFWPLGLRGRVISSIQSFAFPASMDDDDRRRFFLRKTTIRAFSFFPWYKTTHLMKCWLNHAKKFKHGSSRIKKTHLHFQHKCRAIINSKLLKSVKKFSVPKNQSFAQKCSVENFQVLLRATKLSKVSSGSQDFWNFFVVVKIYGRQCTA